GDAGLNCVALTNGAWVAQPEVDCPQPAQPLCGRRCVQRRKDRTKRLELRQGHQPAADQGLPGRSRCAGQGVVVVGDEGGQATGADGPSVGTSFSAGNQATETVVGQAAVTGAAARGVARENVAGGQPQIQGKRAIDVADYPEAQIAGEIKAAA